MGSNAFGQPMLRKEDTRLLTGRGRFTANMLRPDMAHAAMIRSPHAHARILGIDTAAARAMPGVLVVLTGEDYAADGLGGIPAGSDLIRLPGTPADQDFAFRPEHPALARSRVRFVGDSVAVVVAQTAQQARDAAEAVMVEYDPLPAVTGTAEAAAPGAALVWDEAPRNICFRWSAGDEAAVAAAFARAARVVRLPAINNRIHVGSLETRGAIGAFADGRYTLSTGTQMPHGLKTALAESVFRVPEDRVRVTVADVGGSFGIKNALYPEQVVVLWAARRTGRSVAWVGERADGFLSDYQARDNVYTADLALDSNAHFLALRVKSTAAVGAYLAPKGQLSPTSNMPALAGVYRLPCIHVAVTGVFSNTAPTEVYRGAGRPEAVYLLERLVDHAARVLGMDRLELRRRNLLSPADMPYATGLGLRYDSGDFPAMLDTGLQRADAAGFPTRRDTAAQRGRLRGLGWAHYCERVAGSWAEHAWLELNPDGRVTVLIGTMSNGQGHETAYAQLVADQLGIDPADIDVVQGDTDRIPSGHGTGGSASIAIGGAALADASVDLIRKATPLAADALEAAEADVVFEDGAFRIVGTDRKVALQAVARRLGQHGAPALLAANGFWNPSGPTFPNGCHVAEVEVDPDTGVWTLASYTMLHDFGRVLNPKLLEGQLQGGVTQGIGQAACERVVHDAESGQVLTGSFMDYQIPRADELPPLVLETLPTPAPSHPLGVKGCGEAGAAGGAPAVMNALLDALAPLGVKVLDMPATPERVWQAIRNAR
ncbi:xanthine dehydrogenase family protein molybdopterin-binding subunit [Limobrevibacterium gyesilva]|uniref:Xanthine dehydrogenase family protein molybdopterin-binding subunit n=1 Tax=Limobrevibacterium gyesilva TaxID=2991712 RepID=A0AA42CGP7_9PROT|nr:xanthine dehydrogenase family protein molybdopterin-binding subunit [Limobrevibacterium gyesilva]MCW3474050.1 xanthine dehydrogenase family protein molybdopterin-binding subunit [Limobrevibacterium gyesilva]